MALDVKASYDIRELLKRIAHEEEKTIILLTYDMNVVQDTCEKVIIMNKGKIVARDKISFFLFIYFLFEYK